MRFSPILKGSAGSLSARRAWIEISIRKRTPAKPFVALRKESVDRNLIGCINRTVNVIVALRKESVDRNNVSRNRSANNLRSLSARRAWIEI